MSIKNFLFAATAALSLVEFAAAQNVAEDPAEQLTPQQIVDQASDELWRSLDPENTIYMDLPAGLVVIEMRPDFAPAHVEQIKTLVREGFYDGLRFHRVIEGFMAQGGDPKGDGTGGSHLPNINGEFYRDTSEVADFREIGRDKKSPRLGFINGMPAAAQPEALRDFVTDAEVKLWGVHCPGVMSMARANDPNSANSQFFLMIGDARESLDQRYTPWGWIVDGFEATRRISRGEPPTRPTPLMRVRMASEVPDGERRDIRVMRTDSETFLRYLKARDEITEDGFVKDICDIKVPVKVNGKIER